jgi:hypothetical protein
MLSMDELNVDVSRARERRRASGDAPRPRVYLSAALVTTALAVVGFWPTYFGRLVAVSVAVPSVIHLHAAVFITRLLLFIVQVVFAATGRIRLHMRVGRWMMAYGLVVICAGLMAISEGFASRLATGDVFGHSDGFSVPCVTWCFSPRFSPRAGSIDDGRRFTRG